MKARYFRSAAEFRRWLERNHARESQRADRRTKDAQGRPEGVRVAGRAARPGGCIPAREARVLSRGGGEIPEEQGGVVVLGIAATGVPTERDVVGGERQAR